jgi:uncharacterized protein (DUF1501 family)
MPQSPLTGNRFLVTTYKFGGEENFAKLVPLRNDASPNNQLQRWWDARPAHRYGENGGVFDEAIVKAALANKLGTTPDYALHPNYAGIMPVWAAGDLGIIPSVGVLNEPLPDRVTDIPNYRTAFDFPLGVGAHDLFQIHHTFLNGDMIQSSSGWIGKVMDAVSSTGELSTSLSGLHTVVIAPATPHFMMHKGDAVVPFTLPRNGPAGPSGPSSGISVAMVMPVATATVRDKLLEAIALAADPTNVRHQVWQRAVNAAATGGSIFNTIQTTIPGAGGPLYAVDAAFGQVTDRGWWYSMFHRTARIIETAITLNAGALPIRMAIGLSIGDYDTHGASKVRFEGNATYTSLATEYGNGLAAFRTAMGPSYLNCWNDVVVTDPTDFGRTLWTNGGSGTDHAWAYAMFVAGGLVRGQGKDGSTGLLGPFPDVISTDGSGTRDINLGGTMYPYRSLEETYDQILDWFGLTLAERNAIMVNRTRFSNFVDVLDI